MTLQYSNPHLLRLLAYPRADDITLKSRLQELQSLGITAIYEAGTQSIGGQSILGKGYCGVVILAEGMVLHHGPVRLALKVRRVDVDPPTFQAEAEALGIANQYGIGPKLYAHSDHFIAMEYLTGPTIYQWLQGEVTDARVRYMLGALLHQCYQLDQVGLDHGDLRCITNHVLFRGETPVLIDFSGSSRDRRPANVTTIIQGFFWGTVLPNFIGSYVHLPAKDNLVPLLRQYKQQLSLEAFQQILTHLQLDFDDSCFDDSCELANFRSKLHNGGDDHNSGGSYNARLRY